MPEIKRNFIVEILTPTPRRLTSYRGRASNGLRGLVVGGNYYRTAIVEIPGFEEGDAVGPQTIEISIGNAKNLYTDLYSNSANFGARITISRVNFTGTFVEAKQPSLTTTVWFEGLTAKPRLTGERLVLQCHADMGRRGKSPRTKSRSLLVNHAPWDEGKKLVITVRG